MILTDTSVIISYARGKDAKLNAHLPTVPVATCGIVRAELLAGTRGPADRAILLSLLSTFHHIAVPDSIWDVVGINAAILRSKGLSVPFADVIIATLGMERDIEVWAHNAHFPAMQRILAKLKLYQEPP